MNPTIHVHADDFGVGKKITNTILDCIEDGILNSISIICTTNDFYHGIETYKKIPKKVRLCLHLNLVEGRPLAPKEKISLIINKSGEFKYSFAGLWKEYIFSSKTKKQTLQDQIQTEIEHQIIKYKKAVGEDFPLRIDSHMYFHMIPFVFRSLINLSKKHSIIFIRNPYEETYFNPSNLKNYFSDNIIKHLLLKYLSINLRKKTKELNIPTNQYFIGALSSGNMTTEDVRSGLKAIHKKTTPTSVDILFHPGEIKDRSEISWTNKKAFHIFHTSKDRQKEADVLKTKELQTIIKHYETIFNN